MGEGQAGGGGAYNDAERKVAKPQHAQLFFFGGGSSHDELPELAH